MPVIVGGSSGGSEQDTPPAPVRVVFETALGKITMEIDVAKAPISGENFLKYVDNKFYDGGIVNRSVRPDNTIRKDVEIQVIQFQINPARNREQYPPIPLERTSVTGLKHVDGALSMARSGPDTARGSFSIMMGDQPSLDFGGARNADGQGFAVFGRVVEGMDVVKKIHQSPTSATGRGAYRTETLDPPITVLRAYRLPPTMQDIGLPPMTIDISLLIPEPTGPEFRLRVRPTIVLDECFHPTVVQGTVRKLDVQYADDGFRFRTFAGPSEDNLRISLWCRGHALVEVNVPSLARSKWEVTVTPKRLASVPIQARVAPLEGGASLAAIDVSVRIPAIWTCVGPDCFMAILEVTRSRIDADGTFRAMVPDFASDPVFRRWPRMTLEFALVPKDGGACSLEPIAGADSSGVLIAKTYPKDLTLRADCS